MKTGRWLWLGLIAVVLAEAPSCDTIPEDCSEPPAAWVAALQDSYFKSNYQDVRITASGYREAPDHTVEPRWYVALELEDVGGQIPVFRTLGLPESATPDDVWPANAMAREISTLGEGGESFSQRDTRGAALAVDCVTGVSVGD
jgi:hypothetical protein